MCSPPPCSHTHFSPVKQTPDGLLSPRTIRLSGKFVLFLLFINLHLIDSLAYNSNICLTAKRSLACEVLINYPHSSTVMGGQAKKWFIGRGRHLYHAAVLELLANSPCWAQTVQFLKGNNYFSSASSRF